MATWSLTITNTSEDQTTNQTTPIPSTTTKVRADLPALLDTSYTTLTQYHKIIFDDMIQEFLRHPDTATYRAAVCLELVSDSISLSDITTAEKQREETIKRSYIGLKNERQSLNNEYEADLRESSQKTFDTSIFMKKYESFLQTHTDLLDEEKTAMTQKLSQQDIQLKDIVSANKTALDALAAKQTILNDIMTLQAVIQEQRLSLQSQLWFDPESIDTTINAYKVGLMRYIDIKTQSYEKQLTTRNSSYLGLPTYLTIHKQLLSENQTLTLTDTLNSYFRPWTSQARQSDINLILTTFAPWGDIDCQKAFTVSDNVVQSRKKTLTSLQNMEQENKNTLSDEVDINAWRQTFLLDLLTWIKTSVNETKTTLSTISTDYMQQAKFAYEWQNKIFNDIYERFSQTPSQTQKDSIISDLRELHNASTDKRIINKSIALLRQLWQWREVSEEVITMKNIVTDYIKTLESQFDTLEQQKKALEVMKQAVEILREKEKNNTASLEVLDVLIKSLDVKASTLE